MATGQSVRVEIADGPAIDVPWHEGLTARDALKAAADDPGTDLTFGLQYYASPGGYFLLMVNETYDTFGTSSDPSFFWRFYVDDVPAEKGIDDTKLEPGAVVRFAFELSRGGPDEPGPVRAKHEALRRR